jgi:phage terminase small subunit
MAGNSNSGRKRKPTQLKLIEGRTYGLKERAGEPVATGELGNPPNHFNERQREIWCYALQHAPAGLLKSIDGAILASWCVAQALHEKAVEMINATPAVIKSPNGTPSSHLGLPSSTSRRSSCGRSSQSWASRQLRVPEYHLLKKKRTTRWRTISVSDARLRTSSVFVDEGQPTSMVFIHRWSYWQSRPNCGHSA